MKQEICILNYKGIKNNYKLKRVLVYRKKDLIIARGIEVDYIAQGNDFKSAKKNFIHGLIGQIYLAKEFNKDPFQEFGKPPTWAEDEWNKLSLSQMSTKLVVNCNVKYSIRWD